ncbi:MAG: alkaline phosphatase family protein [Minisyncoccales bacterium]
MINLSGKNYILDLVREFPKMLMEKRLVVFIVDGLGLSYLKLPFLKKSIYRTVFPSSTPTFFYSFHSLLEPKEHGFLEWFMHFENLKKPVAIPPWTTFDGKSLKLKKKEVFPFKSFSEILYEKGFSCFYYTPFANSIFSRSVSKKAKVKEIKYLSQVFPLAQEDFVLIYWPSPDEILHQEFQNETFEIDTKFLEFFIKILYEKLPKKTKLIVFSDHGQTKIVKRYKLPPIGGYPVGGSRVAFYQSEKEVVKKELKKKKIPALVYKLEELEFFRGKINERCQENFGDIIVIAQENIGFNYPFEKHPSKLIGGHGGLSKEEILVNVWFGGK